MKLKSNHHLTTFTLVIILTAFYFFGGLLSKSGICLSGNIALVWPPSGMALTAILRFWPGVALGAVLFALIDGVPMGFSHLARRNARVALRNRIT